VIFDPAQLPARINYQLFVGTVVPRPIAWLGSYSENGTCNLAPFSFFGAVTSAPLTLMVSIGRRKGQRKDSAVNLVHQRQCVVHIPHEPLASVMVATSADVDPDVDEFELVGLASVPSDVMHAPRVPSAAVAFECKVVQHLQMGEGPNDVFFLEAVRVRVADALLGSDGLPDARRWSAVGRLGKNEYCNTSSVFALDRPGEGTRGP
jgi:flavin reductase (DIM6/NTAB) family NADH-FMN oxidoreductase RutF